MARALFVLAEYDDTWLRDSGPITLRDGDRFKLLAGQAALELLRRRLHGLPLPG